MARLKRKEKQTRLLKERGLKNMRRRKGYRLLRQRYLARKRQKRQRKRVNQASLNSEIDQRDVRERIRKETAPLITRIPWQKFIRSTGLGAMPSANMFQPLTD